MMEENIKNEERNLVDPLSFEPGTKYSTEEKNLDPDITDITTKSFEDKLYIVFVVGNIGDGDDEETFDGRFKICKGRTPCYRFIQDMVETYGTEFDVFASKIITETKQTETSTKTNKYFMINYNDAISVYSFCKSVESYYGKQRFDIDSYFHISSEEDEKDDNVDFTEQDVHRIYSSQIPQTDHMYDSITNPSDGEGTNV